MAAKSKVKNLALTDNAITVLERRYLRKDKNGNVRETPVDMFERVAKTVASGELEFNKEYDVESLATDFYNMMTNLEFLPNSPTLMNAGRTLGQLSACFVLPIVDSMDSIFETIKYTALIHKSGGGTGFSFSRLRPKNDIVSSTKGVSSGPVSFMKVFDSATEAVKQGGTRRGANMAILRIDHPDIMDFITAKKDNDKLNNFNISVGLTEKFMEAVIDKKNYNLVNPRSKEITSQLAANEVFDLIVEMAWKNGEPGIIFLDRINKDNVVPAVGEIESTNPCGEQPLLPYESCNLGSINLARMLKTENGKTVIDYEKLERTVRLSVRFLDNVITVNNYPLEEISKCTLENRKIGLGVMGFAELLVRMEIAYNSIGAIEIAEEIMKFIRDTARYESINLAREKGTFPNYPKSTFADEGLEVRNATVTTIAPTGTISIIANASSGIEPYFALSYIRNVMDNDKLIEVNDVFEEIAKREGFYSKEVIEEIANKGSCAHVEGIPEKWRKIFVTSHDISPEWHVKIQAAFQKYTDNAVSKTVNFSNSAKPDDIRDVYLSAYRLGCKGVTVYRDGSRDAQVLQLRKDKEEEKQVFTPIKKRPRPDVTMGKTMKMKTGKGNLYVTVNKDEYGPCEVFASIGKAGGDEAAQSEAITRLISMALRSGIDTQSIVKQLRGISGPNPVWFNGEQILSTPDAIGKALDKIVREWEIREEKKIEKMAGAKKQNTSKVVVHGLTCPECGSETEMIEGCTICRNCGYSKCE